MNAQTSITLAKPKRINRWSKRVLPQQPQVDESADPEFRILMVSPVYLLESLRASKRYLTTRRDWERLDASYIIYCIRCFCLLH